MRTLKIAALAVLPLLGFSQKNKVQTAWRALNDYDATVKDGKADLTYLNKAKDAIDAALVHEDTKNQGKTHAYKARVSYAFYQYKLSQEVKNLEASIQDKNERIMTAYGNTPLEDFELANEEVKKIGELDPTYMQTIQDGLTKGTSQLSEDDIKFTLLAQQMKMESANIAQGKYKAKKYDEAADYFYKTGFMNTMIFKVKDTANFYNACISASKAKNTAKILEYNKKMIDGKIASPYNYEAMYNAHLSKGDTASAMNIIGKGRSVFPNDMALMNLETNYYLSKGKQQEALNNLNASIAKDPKNPVFYLVAGNIYDNLANPKDKTTGKEMDKPANFDELFKKAEENYLKAIEFSGSNKENAYNSNYNLGAMYNNYGGWVQNRKAEKITDLAKFQKENETKSQEFYKKAIPYLEKALEIKADDKPTMVALRKLYLLTGNEAKGKEMNDKIKGVK